jgi:hypothetical protein
MLVHSYVFLLDTIPIKKTPLTQSHSDNSDSTGRMPQDIVIDSNDNVYLSDIGGAHPELSYIRSFLELI